MNLNKVISVIGSTGSIGLQSLDIARKHNLKISTLAANTNIKLLEEQIREFNPTSVAVYNEDFAKELKENVKDTPTKIVSGMDGLCHVASQNNADLVITSLVGMVGILPTIEAIKAKKNIGLANKETLVTAGEIITKLAKEKNVSILPVDSEHSAIFQCLNSNKNKSDIKKILLTASGGPFFGMSASDLKNITPEKALKHPNWDMGAKITIDSATLINKGLEFIEAIWLFDVKPEQIEILVHRESVVHSMVEFVDNSVIAQLGVPDMRIPIQYAISYPERFESCVSELDLLKIQNLSFYAPDEKVFTLLPLCKKAISVGGTMPCAVNAANEEAVKLFLNKKISFLGLFNIIEKAVISHKVTYNPKVFDIINTEKIIRNKVLELSQSLEFKESI
ncbi:MAG: 1-deoxy-D-xylulose-5-phosphate reductoisomerase [Clostridia bacterium]